MSAQTPDGFPAKRSQQVLASLVRGALEAHPEMRSSGWEEPQRLWLRNYVKKCQRNEGLKEADPTVIDRVQRQAMLRHPHLRDPKWQDRHNKRARKVAKQIKENKFAHTPPPKEEEPEPKPGQTPLISYFGDALGGGLSR